MTKAEGIKIVKGNESHLPEIYDLEKKIFDTHDRFEVPRLRYLLRSPNAEFYICLKDGKAIGYGIALKNRLRNGKLKGRIYSLGILSGLRNKGFGSLLLDRLEKSLTNDRVAFITLETKASKSGAKDYFRHMGYEVTEFLPKYYGQVDGLRMKKISQLLPARLSREHARTVRP